MIHMKKFPMDRGLSRERSALVSLLLPLSLLLAGCALELENTRPAHEISAPPPPAGTIYAGWRVFQQKCAQCHGAAATGSAAAPDLLPLMRGMSARRFSGLVLKRYDPDIRPQPGAQDQSTFATRIDEILQHRDTPLAMPAWQGEPGVTAHIMDLYTYLSARAEGSVDSERPPR